MKKTAAVLALLLALLLSVAAARADGGYPTNPYRREALELAEKGRRLPRPRSTENGYSLEVVTAPAFETEGVFNIVRGSGVTGTYTFRVQIYDANQTGESRLMYDFKNIEGDTLTLPELIMPASYEVTLFVFPAGSTNVAYWDSYSFTLEPDATHPSLDDRLTEIVDACRVPGDDWQTALNIHDWLTQHAYYDPTYTMYGADGVLYKGTGVCDSYSKAYNLLLQKAGIPVVRVRSDSINHAWNLVCIDGIWAHVDVTWDDPQNVNNPITVPISGNESHHFFCLSDEFIQDSRYHTSHYGYTSDYACTSMANSAIVRLDEEWPEANTWYDEGTRGTYTDLFQEHIDAGETSFDVAIYNGLSAGGGSFYNLSSGNNYAYFAPKFHLLALVQSAKPWQDANGNALMLTVTFNESDRCFHVEVSAAPTDLSTFTLSLPVDCFICTGVPKCPVPVLVGGEDLAIGTDYEVTWSNNVEPGIATVTVSALGDRTVGSLSADFAILPAGESVCVVPENTVELEAEAFRDTDFTEIVLPDDPVTVGANCFSSPSGGAIQITIPCAQSVIDPTALSGLSNVTVIAPIELTIDGVPVDTYCDQQGWYYEEI